jgi:hypothetical protein
LLSGPFEHLVEPTLVELVPNSVGADRGAAFVLAALVLLASATAWSCSRGETDLLAHLLVPVASTYLLLGVGRFYVTARFVSFLLANVILLVAIGFTGLLDLVRRLPRGDLAASAALVLLVLAGLPSAVEAGRRAAERPIENAKLVGEIVEGAEVEHVLTNSDRRRVLDYYVPRLRVLGPFGLSRDFCELRDAFVYIDHDNGSPDPDVSCLVERAAVRVHVDQRSRGSFEVWIVPPSPTGVRADDRR